MTITTEETLKLYKEGYKDGYNDAVKFYITNPMLNMRPQDNTWPKCPVCGKSGISHAVCYNDHCPSRATFTTFTTTRTTGAIGAAGSDILSTSSPGANGPTGSDGK